MKLHRSPLGIVQTHYEVDRLILAIKRQVFAEQQVVFWAIMMKAVRAQVSTHLSVIGDSLGVNDRRGLSP